MVVSNAGEMGDFAAGATIDLKFISVDTSASPHIPSTLGGSPVVSAYKDNSVTQSTTGITVTTDFDGVTGLNHVRLTTVSDGTFYAAGSSFQLVITTGTVAGGSAIGYVVGSFSIANRPVQSLAASVITAAAIAADAIGASELAADAITEIADGILKRDMSAVTGESSRSLLNALRFLRNKWSISGSTLTVTKEDDSTSAWTAALTTSGSADPVTGSDPS